MFSAKKIRSPKHAGQFYPREHKKLRDSLETYLNDAESKPINGSVIGMLVPHAGYAYSGAVAAHSFKAVLGKAFDDILLLGPSHFFSFPGLAVYKGNAFKTPLGCVSVNCSITEQLIRDYDKVFNRVDFHEPEHALEVELPFMQVTLKPGFNIIPMLIGSNDKSIISTLSDIIHSFVTGSHHIKNRRLVIVSVDLSHFHTYSDAVKLDKLSLDTIDSMDADSFWDRVTCNEIEIDAPGAVYAAMKAFNKLNVKAKILKYANSGDVSGDLNRVVGYSSVIFHTSP